METVNKKYIVTAQVLTPLSRGQGSEKDWAYGVDFLTQQDDEGKQWLYHLCIDKMIAAGVDLDKLSKYFAAGRPEDIKNLIGSKLTQVSDFKMPLPVASVQGLANPIKTFLRNPLTNHPVLAGSSLKGAIRSILFTYLAKEVNKRELKEERNPNAYIFGDMKEGTDFMRFIRVGDFEFTDTCLVNTKIYNLQGAEHNWQGGWKHSGKNTSDTFNPIGFNTIYECLPPGATAEGSIMFADILFKQIDRLIPQNNRKKDIFNDPDFSPWENICDIINNHTLDYLEKERVFFEKYGQAQNAQQIKDVLVRLYNATNDCIETDSCILKMSAGAGFHSITGDWQFDDYAIDSVTLKRNGGTDKSFGYNVYGEKSQSAKSRKIAVSGSKAFSPMGFVKLTFNH